jgi:hypothetical protein
MSFFELAALRGPRQPAERDTAPRAPYRLASRVLLPAALAPGAEEPDGELLC